MKKNIHVGQAKLVRKAAMQNDCRHRLESALKESVDFCFGNSISHSEAELFSVEMTCWVTPEPSMSLGDFKVISTTAANAAFGKYNLVLVDNHCASTVTVDGKTAFESNILLLS